VTYQKTPKTQFASVSLFVSNLVFKPPLLVDKDGVNQFPWCSLQHKYICGDTSPQGKHCVKTLFFFAVLGFELRAYTLNHSACPVLCVCVCVCLCVYVCARAHWMFFLKEGLANYVPGLASTHNPPDLCLLSS
jgi:hypothetical protein